MPTYPHVNYPILDKCCLWILKHRYRRSHFVQVLWNSYHPAAHCLAIPWAVTKKKKTTMNTNCIQQSTSNNDTHRTNKYHTFSYIPKCNFRCPYAWVDLWEYISLVVGTPSMHSNISSSGKAERSFMING